MSAIQRSSKRYPIEIFVEIIDGDQKIQGRTQNLSAGGLCATLPMSVAKGKVVQLQLALIRGEVLSGSIWLDARIVWCTKVGHSFQLGLTFQVISPKNAAHIQEFLEYLEAEEDGEVTG